MLPYDKAALVRREEDSISSGPARDLLHRMDTNGDADADMSEFVRFMESALEGVPDQTIDQRICSLLESRVAGRFQYDFSGLYCGYRGVSAIVAALAADITFESIDLSGCGVNNTGVKELAEVLKTHPVRPSENTHVYSAAMLRFFQYSTPTGSNVTCNTKRRCFACCSKPCLPTEDVSLVFGMAECMHQKSGTVHRSTG